MPKSNFSLQTLPSPTGARLALYTAEAKGTPRGIVHINHGLAEHAGRYARFAEFLATRGYHVGAHDHRGHGATTADDGAPRRYADTDGWTKVMGDVSAVEDSLRATWPGLPLIVFGHSMGAVIAFNQVLRQPEKLAGAAIWNGNMTLGELASLMKLILWFEAAAGGEFTPSLTLDKMTFKAWNKNFPERRTDADWLSRDAEEVDKYVNDPICGWPASVSLWRDFLEGVAFAEDKANFANVPRDMPFNLVGGSKDPATLQGKAMRTLYKRLKKAGFTDVDLHILKGFRHETLNEIGREAQMAAFADWLDRVTG